MSSKDLADPSQHWEPLRLPSGLAPADLRTQVCQRLSVLYSVERAIAEEHSELCMAWNCSLLINQLPDELLVSIFAHVADATSAKDSYFYLDRNYPTTKWTKVIKVCRHWRDVAYSSPVLWRAILMRSTAYTQRALTLSNPATIDAFFINNEIMLKNFKLLRPHAQRLRSLSFETIGMSWKSTIFALFRDHASLPALETLNLPIARGPGSTQDPPDADFVDIQLTPERFPYLQSLTLALTVAPQDIRVYARLHKLSLNTCRCDFSFHHFLDALAASTNLESLRLVSILQRIQGDWVERPERTTPTKGPLSLHGLKSLSLVDHPPVCTSRFLSHILLSPSASVYIDGCLGNVIESDVTETVSALLPPNPAAIVPALALVADVSVDVYDTDYCLTGYVCPHLPRPTSVTLRVQSSAISFWSVSSHHGARDLLSVFGAAPLTLLRFTGDCDHVAVETWTEIFNRYPLLETLRLGIAGSTETVFAGLMGATPPTADSLVPCPRLRSIHVAGPFYKEATNVAVQCLRERAEKGSQLDSIAMDLYGSEGDDVFFETEYVAQLRELARESCCSCGELVALLRSSAEELIGVQQVDCYKL